MLRLIYFVAIITGVSLYHRPILAEPQPWDIPNYSIQKSCELFNSHLRPLAVCLSQEIHSRGEAAEIWARTPESGRGKCADLAHRSERGKYQVLSRCLKAAISEAAWKGAADSSENN